MCQLNQYTWLIITVIYYYNLDEFQVLPNPGSARAKINRKRKGTRLTGEGPSAYG